MSADPTLTVAVPVELLEQVARRGAELALAEQHGASPAPYLDVAGAAHLLGLRRRKMAHTDREGNRELRQLIPDDAARFALTHGVWREDEGARLEVPSAAVVKARQWGHEEWGG